VLLSFGEILHIVKKKELLGIYPYGGYPIEAMEKGCTELQV